MAAVWSGSGTNWTAVPLALADATTTAWSGADSDPTTPTRWGWGVDLVRTGMMMAPATTARMTTVPMRKIRPRNRSRISRAATRPTSLLKGP